LKTSLGTLTRVLEAVDWTKISKGDVDAWLYFYEDFLEDYDNELRKRTGSYYTPPEVVNSMVRLVDEALRRTDLFDQPIGLASSDVTVADPAVGTGTFLLGVFRQIANTVARACLTKPSALGARLSTCTVTASASPIRPMAAPKARLGCSAAVVQLSQAGPQPSTHWRQTTAVTAGQNPARGLAAGIYKRSYRPSECTWTAGRAGTGSERPAGPHLRRSPTDCRRIASRRSARPAEGRSLKEKSRKGRTEDTDQRAQKTP
jgi:N-6 DNA Methylase